MQNFTKYKLERAFFNELSLVEGLSNEIWPISYAEVISQEQISFMLKKMYSIESLENQMNNGHEFFLLRMEQKEIGYISVQKNYPDQQVLRIHKFYLLPTFHGKNLGKFMMLEIEKFALLAQMKKLHLNVNRNNKAKDFYSKLGFEIAKEEIIDIGNGFIMDDYVMTKNLA